MKAVDKLPPRSTEEIERDLVEIFGTEQRLLLTTIINELRELVKHPPLTGFGKDNRKFAKRLKAWVDEGDKIFAELPKDFNPLVLFAPPGPLDSEERIVTMAQEAETGHANLRAWLNILRSRCEWVIKKSIGEHRSAGYQQERAAIAAAEMCKITGKELAPTSSTSNYRRAASLFYEAMNGEYACELERACEFVARRPIMTDRRTSTEKR